VCVCVCVCVCVTINVFVCVCVFMHLCVKVCGPDPSAVLTEWQGLEPPALPVIDTVPTMALFFARPHGFVRLIDAETTAAKPSDASFLQHWLHAHTASNSPSARAVTAGKGLQFTVTHFAGPVSYNAQSFLYQNREQVPETLAIVLQGCRLDVIRDMYSGMRTAVGILESADPAAKEDDDGVTTFNKEGKLKVDKKKKKHADTAAANMGRMRGKRFLTSWKALLANLEAATPHYLLCVSPTKAVCRTWKSACARFYLT
jgi:myosin heavy subunit